MRAPPAPRMPWVRPIKRNTASSLPLLTLSRKLDPTPCSPGVRRAPVPGLRRRAVPTPPQPAPRQRTYAHASLSKSYQLTARNRRQQATPVLVREDGRSHAYHRQQQPHTAAPSSSAASRPAFPPSATARAQAHADALEREKEAHEAAASVAPSPPPKAGERSLVCMKWGLVPSWHKKGEKPDYFRAFNARSETVRERERMCVCGKGRRLGIHGQRAAHQFIPSNDHRWLPSPSSSASSTAAAASWSSTGALIATKSGGEGSTTAYILIHTQVLRVGRGRQGAEAALLRALGGRPAHDGTWPSLPGAGVCVYITHIYIHIYAHHHPSTPLTYYSGCFFPVFSPSSRASTTAGSRPRASASTPTPCSPVRAGLRSRDPHARTHLRARSMSIQSTIQPRQHRRAFQRLGVAPQPLPPDPPRPRCVLYLSTDIVSIDQPNMTSLPPLVL